MSGLKTIMGERWWAKALGLLLVPVLIATGLLAATWNSQKRLSKVEAAIVNLDKAVTIGGQTVPLGRQLSGQLISAEDGQNFTWVLADASHASDGLKSGRYAAVVTIPENFSAAATSYAGAASSAKQATIDVATSPVAGIADSAVGQSVAQAAAIALNQTLTQSYLDQIYLGFNTTGTQFQTVADAAKKLADGSKSLTDGLNQAAPGAASLSDGLYKISSNGGLIRSGGSSLTSGISQYTSGVTQSATGAAQLSAGLDQLSANSAQLRDGVTKLNDGLAAYEAGLKQYTDGSTLILSNLPAQVDVLIGLRKAIDQLFAGVDPATFAANAKALTQWLNKATADLETSSATASSLAGNLGSLASNQIDNEAAKLTCPVSVGIAGSEACNGYLAGVAAARDASRAAVTNLIDNSGLSEAIDSVTGDSTKLSELVPKAKELVDTMSNLAANLDKFPSVATLQQEKDGATQLAASGPSLVSGFGQLRAGVSQQLGGEQSLEYGINSYTAGVDQAATGARQLSAGLDQLSSGGSTLSSGARKYVSGVNQVIDGIDAAAPGAKQLADGVKQSADGSSKLTDGMTQLANGLSNGATQIPSYTSEDRTQLSKVVASPISVSSLDGLVQPGAALAALLMVLALWAGAFATYLVIPALRRRLAMSSNATVTLVAEAFRPGLMIVSAQALLVSVIGQAFLRLPAPRWLAMTLLLIVAGVAFVAVNHALAALGKGAGRVLGVAVAVITLATALTSAVPTWLDVIRPLSPLSPAYDAIRAVVSSGTGITGAVFGMIAWVLVGALLSVAAIIRARTVTPAELAAVS